MIVFTSAFETAEETAGNSLLKSRIGWHTLTRDAAATDVTVTSETSTGPKDSPLRSDSYSYWEPSAVPATWTLELAGSPAPSVDYVGIAAHTLGTNGNTVTVYTSAGVSGSPLEDQWTIFAEAEVPTDDRPLMFLDSLRSAARMRVVITGGSAPRVGVIYVGQVLKMTEAIRGAHTPLTLSRQTVLRTALSRGGQFLGQTFQRRGYRTSVAFDHLDGDWYRDEFDNFVEAARQYPYFFGWRPSNRPSEVGYVWTPEDIAPSTMGFDDLISVSWSIQGLGDEA